MVLVDRLGVLACNSGDHHNAAHAGHVRKLRQSGHDVANGIDAFFSGFHPFVYVNITTFSFDVGRLLQANLLGLRPAPNCHQHFFCFQPLLFFTLGRKADGNSGLSFFNFFDFSVYVAIDAFFLE